SFELPTSDEEPSQGISTYDSLMVNNTVHRADSAITVITNPHQSGVDTLTTAIVNNILAAGREGIRIDGVQDQTLTVLAKNVFGQSGNAYAGDLADQTGLNGNISADPLFADPNTGDFTLRPGSPCIDAGVSGSEVPATDYAGVSRPRDGNGDGIAVPDIGAF